MNHYPHHIGDYLKDTAHLDPLEDGIYRRMLDLYYTIEGPLEAHIAGLCRRLRLDARKHGAVVTRLLAEFFHANETGTHWHHTRCDAEIAKYQEKAAANRKNGKAGGRPKQTQQEPTNNPDGFCENENPETQNNLNQNQNQNQVKALSGNPDAMDVLNHLNLSCKAAFQPVEANLKLIRARLKEYDKTTLFRVVDAKKAEWTGTEQAQYLRPATLFNAEKCGQYVGQLDSAKSSAGGWT